MHDPYAAHILPGHSHIGRVLLFIEHNHARNSIGIEVHVGSLRDDIRANGPLIGIDVVPLVNARLAHSLNAAAHKTHELPNVFGASLSNDRIHWRHRGYACSVG
jgi:hypothetical protein